MSEYSSFRKCGVKSNELTSKSTVHEADSSFYHECYNEYNDEHSKFANLIETINALNGCNYAALKSLVNKTFLLSSECKALLYFTHIQPDPFAPGSEMCVQVSSSCNLIKVIEFKSKCTDRSANLSDLSQVHSPSISESEEHTTYKDSDVSFNNIFVSQDLECSIRRIATEDYILRCFINGMNELHKSGALCILRISPHVIARSTVHVGPLNFIKIYLRVKLPGHGRRIDSSGILHILLQELRLIVEEYVFKLNEAELMAHVNCVCDQEYLRSQLKSHNLVAFVADGAILPRAAGNNESPLPRHDAVLFTSPPSLRIKFYLPYSQQYITGMGLCRGLTLIAGGGFHGKSTLMRAIELGIYNHIPEDGRTYVVCDASAMKIRAEDRRSIGSVDISPFINHLPGAKETSAFTTRDASGSTSQAANIMEAIELGSSLLLLDEDTSSTNFLYRDKMMEELVPAEKEPITPFVHLVRELYQKHNISVVMVAGGSGQYFAHANVVLALNEYCVRDVTREAHAIARSFGCTDVIEDNYVNKNIKEKGELVSESSMESVAITPHGAHVRDNNDVNNNNNNKSNNNKKRFKSEVKDFTISEGNEIGQVQPLLIKPINRYVDYVETFKYFNRSISTNQSKYSNASYHRIKVSGSGLDAIRFANEMINLTYLEQIVEEGQVNAMAQCLAFLFDMGAKEVNEMQIKEYKSNTQVNNWDYISSHTPTQVSTRLLVQPNANTHTMIEQSSFSRLMYNCEMTLRDKQLELRSSSCYLPRGFSALPRVFEIGAALNRLRTLRIIRRL